MKKRYLLLPVVAGAIAGLAIVFGGFYNVSARQGHWPGIPWVLHSSFESSVELRAVAEEEVPALTDYLAELGARHYATACRFCHGAPGEPRNGTVLAMEPVPPAIEEAVTHWNPAELGWIVREGVKMTGMPGWPSSRDDEVWAVVAFLTRIPGMTAVDYRELVNQPGESDDAALTFCASCHGRDGSTPNPHVPRLDIQNREYLELALTAYREDRRKSGFMQHAARLVDAETLSRLARHYADREPGGAAWEVEAALAAEGRRLAFAETGDGDVPACRSCHGPWPDRLRPEFPSLAGLSAEFLSDQLRLWRDAERGGGPRHELMAEAAANLGDADIDALAAYYASLTPAKLEEVTDPEAPRP